MVKMRFRQLSALLLLATLCCIRGSAQPEIELYLKTLQPEHRGKLFEKTEETHEVLISRKTKFPTFKIIREYNSRGNLISEIKFNSMGGRLRVIQWQYDANGKPVKRLAKLFANYKGWSNEEVQFSYNPTSGCLKKITKIYNGKVRDTIGVITDERCRVTKALVYNSKGVLVGLEKVFYLPANNSIRVLQYNGNEDFIGSTSYPLDPYGPIPTSPIRRKYNTRGDIVLEALPNSKLNQGYYYEYEYDSYGNWIKKETYQCTIVRNDKVRNKKLEHRITRKITY